MLEDLGMLHRNVGQILNNIKKNNTQEHLMIYNVPVPTYIYLSPPNTYTWEVHNTNPSEIFSLQPLHCKIVIYEQF